MEKTQYQEELKTSIKNFLSATVGSYGLIHKKQEQISKLEIASNFWMPAYFIGLALYLRFPNVATALTIPTCIFGGNYATTKIRELNTEITDLRSVNSKLEDGLRICSANLKSSMKTYPTKIDISDKVEITHKTFREFLQKNYEAFESGRDYVEKNWFFDETGCMRLDTEKDKYTHPIFRRGFNSVL